jgi:pimeloyl-ACP methyl ester carboxylesterase
MLISWVDYALCAWAHRRAACTTQSVNLNALATRMVHTPVGPVRLHDSGGDLPCLLITPDGPNVIAHYAELIGHLKPFFRVVCFDMPGFGQSLPQPRYTHSLDQGSQVVIGVLDSLGIEQAALAFSCANGFYALRAAQRAPERIQALVLSQTPSLPAMHAWVSRTIPKPLRVPVLGQIAAWLFRHKAARSWYRIALPRATRTDAFAHTAAHAMRCGGCFCLAGVVQGLSREPQDALHGALQGALQSVQTPCTLVWGGLDRSHRHTDPRSLQHCVPHARIVYFDDCGHFPDIEQAARFAAQLRNLLIAPQAATTPLPAPTPEH